MVFGKKSVPNGDQFKNQIIQAMVEQLDNTKEEFLFNVHRAEADDNPRIYLKAIRCTLIALGYPEDYVNGDFYDYALTQYPYNGGTGYGSRNT